MPNSPNSDLREEFAQGYGSLPGAVNPYYATSRSSEAWYLGRYWNNERKAFYPADVQPSRGHALKTTIDGSVWTFWKRNGANWIRV